MLNEKRCHRLCSIFLIFPYLFCCVLNCSADSGRETGGFQTHAWLCEDGSCSAVCPELMSVDACVVCVYRLEGEEFPLYIHLRLTTFHSSSFLELVMYPRKVKESCYRAIFCLLDPTWPESTPSGWILRVRGKHPSPIPNSNTTPASTSPSTFQSRDHGGSDQVLHSHHSSTLTLI